MRDFAVAFGEKSMLIISETDCFGVPDLIFVVCGANLSVSTDFMAVGEFGLAFGVLMGSLMDLTDLCPSLLLCE